MAGEGKLQDKIIDFLKPYKDVWVMNKWGNAIEHGGIPDLILCINGMFVAMELKNPNKSGKVSSRQRIELKKIRNSGGLSYQIDSFEEFRAIFKQLY